MLLLLLEALGALLILVFIVSWVNADEKQARKSFSDYMREGFLEAVQAAERAHDAQVGATGVPQQDERQEGQRPQRVAPRHRQAQWHDPKLFDADESERYRCVRKQQRR